MCYGLYTFQVCMYCNAGMNIQAHVGPINPNIIRSTQPGASPLDDVYVLHLDELNSGYRHAIASLCTVYGFFTARGVLLRTVMGEVLRVTERMEAPVPHVLDMTAGVVTAIRRTVNKTPTVRAAATAAA